MTTRQHHFFLSGNRWKLLLINGISKDCSGRRRQLTKSGVLTQIATSFDSLHIEAFLWNGKMSVMEIYRQLL